MPSERKKYFCDINPTCYKISLAKEILVRHLQDLFSGKQFAKTQQQEQLPNLIWEKRANMIKRAPGVELDLQLNKAENIRLACKSLNGIIVRPGEEFSFWRLIGKITKRKGYKEGRIIYNNRLMPGLGGGLCNLGNTVHLLALHSPMKVTEWHKHSDALAPDEGKRVPFSAGTSVSYNNLDFRFVNTTDQDMQLCLWCEGEELVAQIRSQRELPWVYEIVEEDHHFQKEGEFFYSVSKIYKRTIDRQTNETVAMELVWDNHSEVLFDYDLIPKEKIR